jgi:hypothetical protein
MVWKHPWASDNAHNLWSLTKVIYCTSSEEYSCSLCGWRCSLTLPYLKLLASLFYLIATWFLVSSFDYHDHHNNVFRWFCGILENGWYGFYISTLGSNTLNVLYQAHVCSRSHNFSNLHASDTIFLKVHQLPMFWLKL